jgi:hypothetical protein
MRRSRVILAAAAAVAALLLLRWVAQRRGEQGAGVADLARTAKSPGVPRVARSAARITAPVHPLPTGPAITQFLQQLLDQRGARPHEALLTFADSEAYRRFLSRAPRAGLTVLGQIEALRVVRVRYDSLSDLQADLVGNPADYTNLGANFYINIPQTPAKEDRAAVNLVPLGDKLRQFLGVTGDSSQWGRGVTIAVLDSGVVADSTFGQGRLQYLDVGLGTAAGSGSEDGHGTAVAALAAGMSTDAAGVAPAAGILSVRVTDANGQSDLFTLSAAILAAVDAGAQIINISLGGYGTNEVLADAIAYAGEHGAVIVASAGNDQAAQLTWPAADSRVISVGAVDALEQQATFSNSGDQLQISAPGYGVQTAWLNGQRVYFDGTSASAPIVAGAIAAILSTNPGMTATEAWQILQQYSDDAGAPGRDSDYGSGVVDLGWAMSRNDSTRVDTAISGSHYDSATGQVEFTVQNRSGQSVSGLVLNVDANGSSNQYRIPTLAPGATSVVNVAVDSSQLANGIVYRSELLNPSGVVDRVPANNRRTSSLSSLNQ